MCFGGGGGGGTIDSGAAQAAKEQAAVARENAAREEARWQREQDRIAKEKADQAAEGAKQEAERAKLLSEQQAGQRAQLAAQGETGVGANIDSIQTKKRDALAGYDTMFNELKNKTQAQQVSNASGGNYLGQSNTLVSQSGFNTQNTGGKRYYSKG
jgi:hypothetical protein